MSMLPTSVPFPSSGDNENILITLGEKRARCDALIVATNSSKRSLLQRDISSSSSSVVPQASPRAGITILTNPARTRTRPVPPIHEEETHSLTICRSSSSSPAPPRYTILSNPARTRSPPPIQNAPSSSRPVPQSHLPPRITILTNPAREKQRTTQPGSTQSTQSNQNASAATAPTRVPITTPISILKAPTSASQTPAPARAPTADIKPSKPTADVVKEELKVQNVKAKALLPKVVVHEPVSCEEWAETGVHHPGTGMSTDTTSYGQMLGVPVFDSRSRLQRNDLARYYPEEHAAEQTVRSRRLAAARRREGARRRMQTITKSAATPTSSVALIVSRINARTSAPSSTGKNLRHPNRR